MRKCPTLLRVRGLTIPEIGHPPAECGIKTKDLEATAPLGLFSFWTKLTFRLMLEGFFAVIMIIPIKILVFIGGYDIFLW
ncbi:hypothetical protein BABA_07711 [Neobacillus bataviensis LMG 21833]|uniref:Uncharacterized protein n=1 Tax=Neobacillus bataviensis LMG 21833 TaxID=1117379 RepID=K6CFI8_9BACI|nr:hypothetical protein BABA_07711 [Neobacillus bataviensis LMG 21833]